MGFSNLNEEAGLKALDSWLATRSYVESYSPSQADTVCFNAIESAPDTARYPHAARWYKHIASYQSELFGLAEDANKSYKDYGPDLERSTFPESVTGDDGDVDLFGSDDEEDVEAERIREQRLADYKARKASKPKTIAKSVVILDVKPWDDETDMAALEAAVRGIDRDGLVWGTSKLLTVGYGIKKLQLNVVVEDDKVSTQDLQDEIESFDEYVQSSDIVAFQKL
ncbi:proteasome subunit alpha type 3 [Cordyceps javanica]|uniref:Proteasome subunit alpha type 3 n=1 Tax=Cordyceps javanica TaxID=43265 RepID=A0A545V1U6_9HYPO|nr:proteasome subunit alpha type 3 [Cordyceps javanica]